MKIQKIKPTDRLLIHAYSVMILLLLLAGCNNITDSDYTDDLQPQIGQSEMATLDNAQNRVDVCHVNGKGEYQKITVADAAFETHIAHGDASIGDEVPDRPGYIFDEDCAPQAPNFFLADNGITIRCPDAKPGATGDVNGVEYEAVDRELLIVRRDQGEDLTRLCTTPVTDMSEIFTHALSFNQDIGNWDTGNVTDMSEMFSYALSFNQDIGNWDTGNVTDMTAMFADAEFFNQDLSGWCVSNIPSMPMYFDSAAFSWTLPRPVWGTCPGS